MLYYLDTDSQKRGEEGAIFYDAKGGIVAVLITRQLRLDWIYYS
jgi:hypothetical protein